MQVTRMYAGPDGVSHFEDLKVPARVTKVGDISRWFPAASVLFREVPQGLYLDCTSPTTASSSLSFAAH